MKIPLLIASVLLTANASPFTASYEQPKAQAHPWVEEQYVAEEIEENSQKQESDKKITGIASWYSPEECLGCRRDRVTACGGVFDGEQFTAAAIRWKCGQRLMVSVAGRRIQVVVTDHGGFDRLPVPRILDLSRAAFKELAPLGAGLVKVEIEVIK